MGHKVNSRGQASDLCWHTVLVCRIIETKNLQSAECLPTYYCELSVKEKPIPAKKKRVTYLYNLRRNSLQIRPLVGHKVNRRGQSSDLYWHTALSADSAATALVLGAEQQLGRV